ncbi:MAG: DNA polymerase III subunit delta [Candidatus Margulisiibacteriota bacterium]
MNYLLFGTEEFLVSRKIDEIKRSFLGDGYSAADCEILDGESAGLNEIIAKLSAVSMFSERKVFVVKNLTLKKSRRKKTDKDKEKDFSVLAAALAWVPPETCIIFVYAGDTIESGSPYADLTAKCRTLEFKPYSEWQREEVADLVQGFAKDHGARMDKEAARYLVALSGLDLRLLDSEVQKLANYCGPGEEIHIGEIDKLVSPGNLGIFKFTGFLKAKNRARSLSAFRNLRAFGEEPAAVIAVLASAFRVMVQVKLLSENIRDPFAIARQIGASPYFIKQVYSEVRQFSLPELKSDLVLLHAADRRIKQGINPDAEIESLIVEICEDGRRYA